MQQKFLLAVGAACAAAFAALPATSWACATCGCSLSSDAAQGYTTSAGWRVSLEYDYIDQNQLRTGTSPIPAWQVAAINDAGGSQEIERQTINRYLNLGLMYAPSSNWNVLALIPYVDRSHTTYGPALSDQLTPGQVSEATSTGLGDAKLIASYQGFLPTHNLGVQFGVKLPTGNYGGQNVVSGEFVGRNPVSFNNGPNLGSALDTSLNVGTGSTDVVLGAYYYRAMSQNFDAFVNSQFQSAVSHRLEQPNADYRPGNLTSVNFGVRYEADPRYTPQLQFNVSHKSTDQGALADTLDTGGTVLYVSPGISAAIAKGFKAYGFVTVPLYSKLEGYQLFPRWTASVGVTYAF